MPTTAKKRDILQKSQQLYSSPFEYLVFNQKYFSMIDAEDISTEEFSDVSQDRESELIMKKENEKIEQIQEYKLKLERLENDELDELKKVWQ